MSYVLIRNSSFFGEFFFISNKFCSFVKRLISPQYTDIYENIIKPYVWREWRPEARKVFFYLKNLNYEPTI